MNASQRTSLKTAEKIGIGITQHITSREWKNEINWIPTLNTRILHGTPRVAQ